MPAPKNNQFWKLRSKHGRDKLFATPELLWEAACEYFQWCQDNPIPDPRSFGQRKIQRPYTLQSLCLYLNANTAYFRQFKSTSEKDFSTVISAIEETIYTQQYENAVIGVYKENIIARTLGLSDKQDNRLVDSEGNDRSFEITLNIK